MQAQVALAAGQFAVAEQWARRAARLLPNDASVVLVLASATVATDPAGAVAILQRLTERLPFHGKAALALCATLVRAGRPTEAARCFSDMLGRLTPPAPISGSVGDTICVAAGLPGWVWLDGAGICRVRLTGSATASVRFELDGRALGSLHVRRGQEAARTLPEGWWGARRLVVQCRGRDLAGSGLAPYRFGRIEAYAAGIDGGVAGWARLPADPTTRPALFLRLSDGSAHPIAFAPEPDTDREAVRWRFALAAHQLAGLDQAEIVDAGGAQVWGSPVSLGAERAAAKLAAQSLTAHSLTAHSLAAHSLAARGSAVPPTAAWDCFRPLPAALLPAPARRGATPARLPPCDVVVPVHGGAAELERCLASLTATLPRASQLVLVNDGSPDPAITARLRAAAGPRVTVLEHPRSLGFPAAVNAGLASLNRAGAGFGPGRDVVILNADTVVGPRWLQRLSAAAHSDPAVGSVTPLTNDGTIVSYPAPGEPGPAPDAAALAELNRLCWAANGAAIVPIPTGVGFCMLMKGGCLAETGLLREDVFAQGYGEENDWCLRAAHLGWQHAAAPGVFVAHSGGRSFGPAKALLLERNAAVLERLHPGYAAYVAAALAPDPLEPARRRIDRLRLLQATGGGAAILITHDAGGGVARRVAERSAAITASGGHPVVLFPEEAVPGRCHLALGAGDGAVALPNLHFDLPSELDDLVAVLQQAGAETVEFHHLLNHHRSVGTLPGRIGVPYEVHVHDYGHWCPRISLTGRGNRYCGEPLSPDECEDCIADLGSQYPAEVTVRSLRAESAGLLGGARAVLVACEDVASRIRRQFPGVTPVTTAWEDTAAPLPPNSLRRETGVHVVVAGAIGIEKGYEILLGCARDAARRKLDLRFTVAGLTLDDDRLMATGRVFVTGRFAESEALGLVGGLAGTIGFAPSVCPETWMFTLSLLWRAGLPVLAFALGAQGERIGRSGSGWLMPLGLPVAKINDALVSRGYETIQSSQRLPAGIE